MTEPFKTCLCCGQPGINVTRNIGLSIQEYYQSIDGLPLLGCRTKDCPMYYYWLPKDEWDRWMPREDAAPTLKKIMWEAAVKNLPKWKREFGGVEK